MKDKIDKLLFCVRMLNLSKWFTNADTDDYRKRILSRSIFLYLDAFFIFAAQIKNTFNSRDLNTKSIHKKLNAIKHEYDNYHKIIRDKLGAHRQDLDIFQVYEYWNEIDLITLNYYITEVQDIYNLIHALNTIDIPAYSDFSIVSSTIIPNSDYGFVVSIDTLAPTRSNYIWRFQKNIDDKFNTRILQINSIIDSILYLKEMYPSDDLGIDLKRLVKSILIIDVINLLDNIFTNEQSQEHQTDSFYKIAQRINHNGYTVIIRYDKERNLEKEVMIRHVRNKICAHIDDKEPLKNLLKMLDFLPIDDICNLSNFLIKAYIESCSKDIRTQTMLLINTPLDSSVVGLKIKNTEFQKPFD
ncbi:MAG: hypothetical protein QE277_00620 [Flectobacillus sp.]|nr:hypothetical protein [Flectobacillus sp.]